MMRMEQCSKQLPKESKVSQNASTKVMSVVSKILLPLLEAPVGNSVSFQVRDVSALNREYFESLSEIDPETVKDRDKFIERMAEIYDKNRPC